MQAKYPNRTEVGSSIPESTLKVNREMCGSSFHARSRSDSSMGGRGGRPSHSTQGGRHGAVATASRESAYTKLTMFISQMFHSIMVDSGGRVVSSPRISRTIRAARTAAQNVWGQKDEEPGAIQRYVNAFIEVCLFVVGAWMVAGIIVVLMHTAGAF